MQRSWRVRRPGIMGGEEMPPPGSRGGPDDIAAPVQSSEESLRNMMMAENKKNERGHQDAQEHEPENCTVLQYQGC